MKKPLESDYNSYAAYTRALEMYCDSLAQFDQRKPLTDEWIRQTSTIWSGIQSEEDAASMTAKDMTEFDCLKWLVRKTEAAHNIGAKT